jgi:hypothetical protein
MVPLYVAALRMLAGADAAEVRRWYRAHKKAAAMQLWMEQQHSLAGSTNGNAAVGSVKATPSPSAPLSAPVLPSALAQDNTVKTFRDSPLVARKAPSAVPAAAAESGGAPPPPLPAQREVRSAVQPMELEVIDLP